MMDAVVIALLVIGCLFVVMGTLGLLRFPDLPTRLHAVAKADNLGLGFIVAALVVDTIARSDGAAPTVAGIAAKLVLIWLLALVGTAGNSHLLAGSRRAREEREQRSSSGSES